MQSCTVDNHTDAGEQLQRGQRGHLDDIGNKVRVDECAGIVGIVSVLFSIMIFNATCELHFCDMRFMSDITYHPLEGCSPTSVNDVPFMFTANYSSLSQSDIVP